MDEKFLRLYMFLPVVALVLGIVYVFGAEDKFRYECQDPVNWEQAYCQPPLCEASAACTKDLIYDGDTVVKEVLESGIDLTPEPPQDDAAATSDSEVPIEEILNDIPNEDQTNE